jgi:hypothetical protein
VAAVTGAPAPPTAEAGPGLVARAWGVIAAPRATYAAIAARPRASGALAVVVLVGVVTSSGFLTTEVGKEALLDRQLRVAESFNVQVTDQMYGTMQAGLDRARYAAALGQLLVFPLGSALAAGVAVGVFKTLLGGTATFRQAFAVIVHSELLLALQQLLATPLNYTRGSMSSATNLAVFFPMLDELSLGARLLGTIDLFWIWWLVNLAIGFGVLYRRPTVPIAGTLLALYGAIAIAVAGAVTLFAGA